MKLATLSLAATAALMTTFAAGTATTAVAPTPLSAAPASGTGLPSGQCIRSSEIRNHTVADKKTLLLNVAGRETYRVTMSGGCLSGAISSDPIVTRVPPGSSIICKPLDLDLSIARAPGFPSRCIVDSIVKMSREEVEALPKRLRP